MMGSFFLKKIAIMEVIVRVHLVWKAKLSDINYIYKFILIEQIVEGIVVKIGSDRLAGPVNRWTYQPASPRYSTDQLCSGTGISRFNSVVFAENRWPGRFD